MGNVPVHIRSAEVFHPRGSLAERNESAARGGSISISFYPKSAALHCRLRSRRLHRGYPDSSACGLLNSPKARADTSEQFSYISFTTGQADRVHRSTFMAPPVSATDQPPSLLFLRQFVVVAPIVFPRAGPKPFSPLGPSLNPDRPIRLNRDRAGAFSRSIPNRGRQPFDAPPRAVRKNPTPDLPPHQAPDLGPVARG